MACVTKRRGKWVLDFRDQHGRRRWETYETKREAEDARAERRGQVKHRRYRAPSELPTFSAVAADWFGTKMDRAPATIDGWRNHIRHHLDPVFGPRRIDLIELVDIERFKNAEQQKSSRVSVNSYLTTLAAIFTYAQAHRYIQHNPAKFVGRVKRERLADDAAGEGEADPHEVLTAAQVPELLQATAPGLMRVFFTLALATGLRNGEELALAWSHIDPKARTLRVCRSLVRVRGEHPGYGTWRATFGPPKTDSSYRTLELAPQVITILNEWKMQSTHTADDDLVFCNQRGGPLHRAMLWKGLQDALKRCPALPRITLHSFRHTFASLLILDGRPPTQVAKLLGHTDATITMKVYAHWFRQLEERNRLAMTALADQIFGASGSKTVADTAPVAVSA
jgi:integrase